MKTFNFRLIPMLCLATIFILSSCSKDDLQSSIVGEWKVMSFERDCENDAWDYATTYPDGCDIEDYGYDDVIETCLSLNLTEEGGTYLITENGVVESEHWIRYTVDEENQTVELCVDGGCNMFTVDGNIMTFEEIDETCTTIQKFIKS